MSRECSIDVTSLFSSFYCVLLCCWYFLAVSTIFACTHWHFTLFFRLRTLILHTSLMTTEVLDAGRITDTTLWIFHLARFYQYCVQCILCLSEYLYSIRRPWHFWTRCKVIWIKFKLDFSYQRLVSNFASNVKQI